MELKKINHIKYWLKSAEENFVSMENIFNTGEYSWSLFIGHLAIESYLCSKCRL
ncbi:MAG: HEPN domain-containing protein [Candidatus Muiribacteriota bacterium]|jgi:HEPN domain-containing protein